MPNMDNFCCNLIDIFFYLYEPHTDDFHYTLQVNTVFLYFNIENENVITI